jgi:hypothetical protein
MRNEDHIAVRIFWNDSLSLGTWIPRFQQFQTPCRLPHMTYHSGWVVYKKAIWQNTAVFRALSFTDNQGRCLQSSLLLRRVVCFKFTNVLEVLATSITVIQLPDDGSGKHLWNVGKLLPDCTAQLPRRQQSSHSPPWASQTSLSKEQRYNVL